MGDCNTRWVGAVMMRIALGNDRKHVHICTKKQDIGTLKKQDLVYT